MEGVKEMKEEGRKGVREGIGREGKKEERVEKRPWL